MGQGPGESLVGRFVQCLHGQREIGLEQVAVVPCARGGRRGLYEKPVRLPLGHAAKVERHRKRVGKSFLGALVRVTRRSVAPGVGAAGHAARINLPPWSNSNLFTSPNSRDSRDRLPRDYASLFHRATSLTRIPLSGRMVMEAIGFTICPGSSCSRNFCPTVASTMLASIRANA